MTSILALTLSATLSSTPAPPPPPRAALLTQTQRMLEAHAPPARFGVGAAFAPPGGDSLKNGALVGGLVAGAASAIVLGYICHVFNETGDPICVEQVAWRSAVAAAGGAVIGAGIDAMLDRQQFGPPSRPEKISRGAIAGPALRVRLRF